MIRYNKFLSSASNNHAMFIPKSLLEEFALEKTNIHRIYSSPGLWIERYHQHFIISHLPEMDPREILKDLREWLDTHQLVAESIYTRLVTNRPNLRQSPVRIFQESESPYKTTAQEWGLSYQISFAIGYSVGFFMDQRLNRKYLIDFLNTKRAKSECKVLNLFAYTCSFSVVAASMGCDTLNVDTLRSHLDRGRENFRLNHINPQAHGFFTNDVREILPRLRRQRKKFDVIILDPPTFSHAKKIGPFHVEKNLPQLIEQGLQLLSPLGKMLISTNCLSIKKEVLRRDVEKAAEKLKQICKIYTTPNLQDFSEGKLPLTFWVQLSD
ncbi:MAG: class I SAM-dependent methyltransferase [Verrucomicrobiota bacterium]